MKNELDYKPNIMFCLALVLLCLAGISTCFISGVYAKYTSEGVGSSTARVASFKVNAVMDAKDKQYNMGETDTVAQYEITLKNDSEVAVSYSIVLTFEDVLPAGVEPMINENTGNVSEDQKMYTFDNIGQMEVNSETKELLEFVPDKESVLENYSDETDMEWIADVKFKVAVEFVQKD